MINYAKQKKLSFITYLIHAKKIDSNYLAQLLAKEFLLTFIDLDTIDPSQLPIHLINENLLELLNTIHIKINVWPINSGPKSLGIL